LTVNGCETSDADFSWREYAQRTNKELIGNFANFIYRTAQLIEKNLEGQIVNDFDPDKRQTALIEKVIASFESTGQLIEQGRFREAIRDVFNLAEEGNRFLAETEPWKTVKTDKEVARKDLVTAAQVIYSTIALISPFLPRTSGKIRDYFESSYNPTWEFEKIDKLKIKDSKPIFARIEEEQIEAEVAKLGK
jgi:methionyl-tRNA synthetase